MFSKENTGDFESLAFTAAFFVPRDLILVCLNERVVKQSRSFRINGNLGESLALRIRIQFKILLGRSKRTINKED